MKASNRARLWNIDDVVTGADIWPGDMYQTQDGKLYELQSLGREPHPNERGLLPVPSGWLRMVPFGSV